MIFKEMYGCVIHLNDNVIIIPHLTTKGYLFSLQFNPRKQVKALPTNTITWLKINVKYITCANREESPPLDDKSRFLVLVNYFRSIPMKELSYEDNSGNLINMLHTCDGAAATRLTNFVVVDYYHRSEGGGSFQAMYLLNGKLYLVIARIHSSCFDSCGMVKLVHQISCPYQVFHNNMIPIQENSLTISCIFFYLQPGSTSGACTPYIWVSIHRSSKDSHIVGPTREYLSY
ncbi:LOW QUALITY PROTEIN: hypothetical protein NC652_038299 [Populus alba x Populus x berolinensis]|nr:LOW QUALITY PROTEIN: hypothetical protein NC652_038299 [Populus alba x Populus x berolinensis]